MMRANPRGAELVVGHAARLGLDPIVYVSSVAAVLTPSTDPFTQALLAIPLVGLYMGGAAVVRFIETSKGTAASSSA